tara:strand:- start:1101 stop:1697 length:597 start_codon:yes stop_codon:yes gene_type:complete
MPCVDNKNLIYNIKELPETFSVADGDLFLIETDEGTNIMDFANFIIGLDNTTFGTTITQHTTDISTLSSDFDSLSSQVDTDMTELSATIVGNTTKALVTLSGDDAFSAVTVVSNNIASVEYIVASHVVRFNFNNNFSNTNYIILPSAPVLETASQKFVQFVESDKATNYVDLSAINIDNGSIAYTLTSSAIGFQIQTF